MHRQGCVGMSVQESATIDGNIEQLFQAVNNKPTEEFLIKCPANSSFPDDVNILEMYHQQGIQKHTSGGFVVSGSAKDNGYLYLTDSTHEIVKILDIEHDHDNYNHVGGIQVVDDILVIGYEHLETKNRGTSRVLFYDIENINQPRLIPNLTIQRKSSYSTAGNVALSRFRDTWLLLVANWDCERLDFYKSTGANLRNEKTVFSPTPDLQWTEPTRKNKKGWIDKNWEPYQNINMFTQTGDTLDSLWFIGMHAKCSINWADLYQLNYGNNGITITKRNKKMFRSGKKPGFRWGSGYHYNELTNRFEVYACSERIKEKKCVCNEWL